MHYNKSAWRNLILRLFGTWLVQIILRSMHHQTSPSKNLTRDLRIRGSPGCQLGCVKCSLFFWDVQRSHVTVAPLSMPHLLMFPNIQIVNGGNCAGVRMCVGFISVTCPPSLSLPSPPNSFPCNTLCVEYTKQYEVYGKVFPIHAIKTYRGSRSKAPLALNLGIEGGEWLTSRSGRCFPGKESRYLLNRNLCGYHCQCGLQNRKT